jgi:hypothetical protein
MIASAIEIIFKTQSERLIQAILSTISVKQLMEERRG